MRNRKWTLEFWWNYEFGFGDRSEKVAPVTGTMKEEKCNASPNYTIEFNK